jgi:hypothetical protein
MARSIGDRVAKRGVRWALALCLALSAPALVGSFAAQAQAPASAEPPTAPFLRIDPGFHTQVVNRVALDRDARFLVSVSDDKTARVWSTADGALLNTIRVPIADGEEGALYAAALSPDAKTLLLAGSTGFAWDKSFAVYLYDVERQRFRGRLPNLPAPVNHLAFSADGTRFAMALGGRAGIRIHDATNGRLISQDAEYQDRATWIAFDKDGRAAAVGFDGEVRLYNQAGARVARRALGGGGKPYSVAFSPQGDGLVVGYLDQPRVELLNGGDLSPRATLRGEGAGGLGAVAWGSDGVISAAGSLRARDGAILIRRWPNDGKGQPLAWTGPGDTVSHLATTPDGGLIVASADPALMRINPAGRPVYAKRSPGMDFRDVMDRRLALSADGMTLDVQGVSKGPTLRVDWANRTIGLFAGSTAAPAAPGGVVTDWRNRADPKIGGKRVALETEELSRAAVTTADRRFSLIGTDYALRVLRPDATEASQVRLPSVVWGVAVSADGRMAAAALGDGTLRWFALSPEGRLTERLALYLTADGARWIAWTPEGFFDHADGGGKELVGYQLNRAKGQAPDWFSFAQVYRLFYAPDLVAQRLRGQGAEEARTRLASVGDLRQRLDKGGPPRVELASLCWREAGREKCADLNAAPAVTRSAAPEATFQFVTAEQGADVQLPAGVASAEIRFKLIEQNAPAGPVDAFLNNRNVGRSIKGRSATTADGLQSLPVAIDSGVNRLELRAYDQAGQAYSRSRLIRVAAPVVAKTAPQKPKLFVLVAGVNAYARAIGPLNFAVPDAKSFAATVRAGAGDLFREVEIIEFYDDKVRTQALVAAMDRIGAAANPEDTVLIYFAGHGVVADQRYYFVTHNVTDPKAVAAEAFSEAMLVRGMAGIRAKNGMLFLDTCHAGAFSLDSASQLAHESGRYVLAAASSVEEALDSYDNKNGVFATAVLRGLKGSASRPGEKAVNNFELGFFVTPQVKKLAEEKNHRQSARFKIAADDAQPFPIVELKN